MKKLKSLKRLIVSDNKIAPIEKIITHFAMSACKYPCIQCECSPPICGEEFGFVNTDFNEVDCKKCIKVITDAYRRQYNL